MPDLLSGLICVSFSHTFDEQALGNRQAPDLDVAFKVPARGITVLFGPSGSGKTSTLRVVAGLFRPQRARVSVDGVCLTDSASGLHKPTERRRLGVVFQEPRLFPHLSVRGNLLYGARRAGPGPVTWDATVRLLALDTLLARSPRTLSGGERQRVAVGRALLSQPRLLLMDEPLANLDVARRDTILPFLLALRAQEGVPIMYVTHQLDEVYALADWLVLLADGRVLACGSAETVFARGDLPLARARDAGTRVTAVVTAHNAGRGLTTMRVGGAVDLLVPLCTDALGTGRRLRIAAADVMIAAIEVGETSAQNRLVCTVQSLTATGAHEVTVELDTGCFTLLARITSDAASRLGLSPGTRVMALVKATSVGVLPGMASA